MIKVRKGKGPVLDLISYSAAYTMTYAHERFTISEVAADWHELMIPQCIMRPSIARTSEQWTRGAAFDIPPPQSATLGLHPVDRKLLLI